MAPPHSILTQPTIRSKIHQCGPNIREVKEPFCKLCLTWLIYLITQLQAIMQTSHLSSSVGLDQPIDTWLSWLSEKYGKINDDETFITALLGVNRSGDIQTIYKPVPMNGTDGNITAIVGDNSQWKSSPCFSYIDASNLFGHYPSWDLSFATPPKNPRCINNLGWSQQCRIVPCFNPCPNLLWPKIYWRLCLRCQFCWQNVLHQQKAWSMGRLDGGVL